MTESHKSFIIIIFIFMLGLTIGIICGIGLHEIIKPSITVEADNAKDCPDCMAECQKLLQPQINFKEGSFWAEYGDKKMLYGAPVSIVKNNKVVNYAPSDKYFKNYKKSVDNNDVLTLNKLKTPYTAVVFTSPACPYCMQNMQNLRQLRKEIPSNDMSILIANSAAEDNETAALLFKQYKEHFDLQSKDFKEKIIENDPKDFIYTVLGMDEIQKWSQKFSINSIPLTLIFDDKGKLLLRYEGVINGNNAKDQKEIKRRNDKLNDIKKSLGLIGGTN